MNRDLTRGPVMGSMLRFAVPAVGVAGIWWSVPFGWVLADAAGFLCCKARQSSLLSRPD